MNDQDRDTLALMIATFVFCCAFVYALYALFPAVPQ